MLTVEQGHEGTDIDREREYRYRLNVSLTSALDRGGWSTPCPGRFTSGKETPYPFYCRLGKPQGLSSRDKPWLRKISPTPGFDPKTIQAVASRYTD